MPTPLTQMDHFRIEIPLAHRRLAARLGEVVTFPRNRAARRAKEREIRSIRRAAVKVGIRFDALAGIIQREAEALAADRAP